jgi:hypothetical protein
MAAPSRNAQAALRAAGHVVHGVDGIAGVLVEQAVVHHLHGAAHALFGRLEDQVERARELAVPRQVLGRAQQHGRMAVVPAGMHDAGPPAAVGQARLLLDGQRVHVGAQAYGARAAAALQAAHQAGHAQAALDLVAPGREPLGHQVAGAELLEAELGVLVDLLAHRHEFGGVLSHVLEVVLCVLRHRFALCEVRD